VIIAVLFAIFSLGPVVDDAQTQDSNDHYVFVMLYVPLHFWLLTWVMTALVVLAPLFQARMLWRQESGEVTALSPWGLKVQACVFFVVGVAWAGRWEVPSDWAKKEWNFGFLWEWYVTEGWMVLDSLVVAVGQGVLAWVWRRGTRAKEEGEAGEFLLENMEGRPGL
jgi:hypothetical protein